MYVQMLVDDNTLKAPNVLTIGANDEEHALVREGWTTFDAAAFECFDNNDKKRIIAVVENHPGGVEAFNDHVRDLATKLFAVSRALSVRHQSSSSTATSAAPTFCT